MNISRPYAPAFDTKQLLALLAVVDTGTFSAAADELGYTQSAVSQQVAGLERAVGARLFDRPGGPSHVRLTPIGDVLVGHARAIVARLHAAAADVAAVRAGDKGILRVGTMQSIGTKVLPRLLRRYREEHPGIELLPQETWDLAELAAAVEDGRFDLSFAQLPLPEGPFEVRRVLDDPYVLLAPADAPEAGSESVTLRAAARLPLIGYSDPHEFEDLLYHLRRTGIEPSFVFRSNDNPTIQGFVASGLGYALMPRLTVDEDDPEVSVIPSVTGLPPRNLAVVWHADRQLAPVVQHFVELAVEVCADLGREWEESAG
ncbi:MAG: LysR family transcriptional regulator [Sporichthyaceae bacterium]